MAEVRTERSALPRADPHVPRGTPRASRRTRWRVAAWVLVHVLILAHLAHWRIAGTTLSPLEPSEAGETLTLGYVNAGFVLLALAVLATLVSGRFFCGWGCHVVAYQDTCAFLLRKLGIRPRPIRSRLLAWVPLLAAIEMFAVPPLLRLASEAGLPRLDWHLLTDDLWARFPGPGIAALTFAVDGFLIVYLLGSKGFCTYGCPYGAIFGIADRFSRGRIRVTDACRQCGHCTATCTSGVRVHEEVARHGQVVDPGCMKCLDCVDVCPKDALYFGFRAAEGVPARRGRSERRHDFGWGEELVMAVVFLLSLWAWRGLYGLVPFLLAIGLSVIAAFGTVLLARLVLGGELRLRERVLRREGRLTAGGGTAAFGFGLLLVLTVHGGLVQVHDREAVQELERARSLEPGPERDSALAEAERHLDWILDHGLVETAEVHHELGSIHWTRGEIPEAEAAMRRALELDPSFTHSRLVLADIEMRRGAEERALDELQAVLEREPDSAHVGRRLEELVARGAESSRPYRMLVGVLTARNQRNEAEQVIDLLESRTGPSDETEALRRELRAKR